MHLGDFRKLPVLGIIRGIDESSVGPLFETIIDSGLKTVEITMNTENAPKIIKTVVKMFSGKISIGAGTVMNLKELGEALDAGAEFIVTPVLVRDVSKYCIKNKIPIFPGALTPTEIYSAWEMGATMVKVFPASVVGPEYFKEVKGPFNKIDLMAVGGVRKENLKDYLSNGASAFAFGASVFKKQWVENKNFSSIKQAIVGYIEAYKTAAVNCCV